MIRVTLRTLTEKSTLKFGKWHDLTVRQYLQLYGFKGIKYLRWCYYSLSNISFNDDILNELGIHDEIRISKPGKVEQDEIAGYLRRVKRVSMSEEEKFISVRTRNVLIKANRMRKLSNHILLKNKSRNQNRNHGNKF